MKFRKLHLKGLTAVLHKPHTGLQYQSFPSTLDRGCEKKVISAGFSNEGIRRVTLYWGFKNKKSLLSASVFQVWIITYMNFSIMAQPSLGLHLLPQATRSNNLVFPCHKQVTFFISESPWYDCEVVPFQTVLSLAFSQECTLHRATYSCLYLQRGRLLFWLLFKCLLMF